MLLWLILLLVVVDTFLLFIAISHLSNMRAEAARPRLETKAKVKPEPKIEKATEAKDAPNQKGTN